MDRTTCRRCRRRRRRLWRSLHRHRTRRVSSGRMEVGLAGRSRIRIHRTGSRTVTRWTAVVALARERYRWSRQRVTVYTDIRPVRRRRRNRRMRDVRCRLMTVEQQQAQSVLLHAGLIRRRRWPILELRIHHGCVRMMWSTVGRWHPRNEPSVRFRLFGVKAEHHATRRRVVRRQTPRYAAHSDQHDTDTDH